ncbi:MAG TPA: arsenite methyltransferase [Candidatus Bathyarchaeia archaeon]|nr:arsenite methyltransferase [Candidatus Bathyarchaeia archaeon]
MNESIKEKVKERYSKIALTGNSDCCCMPGECTTADSPIDATKIIGYDKEDLQSIPQASILGVGCGAPIQYADMKEGETILDLGSGAGIDVFLSANKVTKSGRVIGIDMTDEMLEKARKNARDGNYTNVEFRKGDIEKNIPVDDNTVDAVISNCVINLTTDKTNAFKEVHRILKKGGRMVISDLVTDRELAIDQVNLEQWCSCIDGALTQEHYLECIKNAGFSNIRILNEQVYMEGEKVNGRKITSLVIKAVK